MSFGRDVGPELRARAAAPRRAARGIGVLRVVLLAGAFVIGAVGLSGVWQGLAFPNLQAIGPALEATKPVTAVTESAVDATGASEPGDTAAAVAAAGARTAPGDPPGWVRIPKPAVSGPRRVGIQAGHWRTSEAPPDLWQLLAQTGASSAGVTETETNLEIAELAGAILRAKGIVVDVLPTIIPAGYVADALVALHSDGDETGEKSGFKLAHSTRRTPHEDALQRFLTQAYGAATGLDYDSAGISRNMTGYYLFSWSRVRYSTSPFTPSVILEMGFLTNEHDRNLIVNEQELLANAIATGILKFLDATPRDALFGQDLVVPPSRSRFPTPSPTPGS